MKPFILLIVFLVFAFIFSCKKEKDDIQGITYIVNSTSYSKWVYFSFEKGDSINIVNPKNSNEWDIAFKRFYIRTNSGLSGMGNAGADSINLAGQNGFNSYATVDSSAVFSVDTVMQVLVDRGYATDTVNPVLYKWFNLNMVSHQIEPINKIFVVKTAKGKYAKIWFKNYYNDLDLSSGYIKFSYVYQSDGSKNF